MDETKEKKKGKWQTCWNCNGAGQVSAYSRGDFHGAAECPKCGGTGEVYRYPSGASAMYPGGPFVG